MSSEAPPPAREDGFWREQRDAVRHLGKYIPPSVRRALEDRTRLYVLLALLPASLARFVAPWWIAVPIGLVGLVAGQWRVVARAQGAYLSSFLDYGRDAGTARTLRGDVAYVVAVDASIGAWAHPPAHGFAARSAEDYRLDHDTATALGEIERGLGWIRDQARARGHEVAFRRLGEVLCFDELSPADLPPEHWTESTTRDVDRLEQVVEARTRALQSSVADSQFFVVVLTTSTRVAFAVPAARHYPTANIEFCVCRVDDPAKTFAHEILHLFGARDLYEETRGPKAYVEARKDILGRAKAAVPSGHLEQSIMACEADLPEATIDIYTERAVGLTRDDAAPLEPEPRVAGKQRPLTALDIGLIKLRFQLWAQTLAAFALLVPWPAPRAALIGGAVVVELVRRVLWSARRLERA